MARRIARRRTPIGGAALALGLALSSGVLAPPRLAAQASDRFAIPATDDGLPGAGPIRRYDWFQNVWRARRSSFAQRLEADRGAVVFLGDSITQGWGGGLGAAFPGVKVANRGIDGDTSRGVLIRLRRTSSSSIRRRRAAHRHQRPRRGCHPEARRRATSLILSGARSARRQMPIVLCQDAERGEQEAAADQIKAQHPLPVGGERRARHPRRDLALFADGAGTRSRRVPDLLHPNEAGYAKWAAALRPIFATLGFSETAADTFALEPGFESLFNGRDLTGWGYRPTSEADQAGAKRWQASDPGAAEWPFVTEAARFDGQAATPDGRYRVIGGRLVVTTPPSYRRIQQLWTTREFPQDFVLKLEFRATPNADSGLYVRGPRLQVRDYLIAGPYKQLRSYQPQDWNEVVVSAQGGLARATCNGELLEAEMKVPASGPIGLEGDRGQMEYRRIRIQTR